MQRRTPRPLSDHQPEREFPVRSYGAGSGDIEKGWPFNPDGCYIWRVIGNRDKKLVYHLTALDNLESILQHGLLSRREVAQRELGFSNVADAEILAGRAQHDLDGMVPFHFIPCSPFDYRVVHENPGVPFILMAVQRAYARANGWKVIPRHPLTDGEVPEVLSWDEGIDSIDWSQMDRHPRPYDDRECKLTCMAEALSPAPVPLAAANGIFVATEETEDHVRTVIANRVQIHVNLNAAMFPKGCP